jgi:hypothetical protein
MALVVKDRVRETSTSTGTANVILNGAVQAFQSFSVIGDGNTTYYAIVDAATGDWEVGIGTYTLSTTTLTRDTILESSSGGTAINFTANVKDVFVTYPAERAVYGDATNVVTGYTITGGSINNTPIGATTASTGAFTNLAGSNVNLTGGAINGTSVGASTASTGSFTDLAGTNVSLTGGTINGTSVGATTASTGAFTDFSASGTANFTSTGSVKIPVGTTAQRPAPSAGMLRFNDDSDEFEGYNGTAWASVGGSAISNDTSTATDLFPSFLNATTGTAASIFTSNAKLLYKPSTGEFKSSALVASNGLVVNSMTVSANYTVDTGFSASSVGPITVNSGVAVTVNSGSRWIVL